jgi:hypothetical protein
MKPTLIISLLCAQIIYFIMVLVSRVKESHNIRHVIPVNAFDILCGIAHRNKILCNICKGRRVSNCPSALRKKEITCQI